MNKISALGTYCRNGKYGVWLSLNLNVGGKYVSVEAEITPPVFPSMRAADSLVKRLHDLNDKRTVERLAMGTDFITHEERIG